MKLRDALDQIDTLSDDDVIFARRPWRLDSDAEIERLDAGHRAPALVMSNNLDYFLEVFVAKDVLNVLAQSEVTPEKKRELLMFYAVNDAYPGWVYE